MNPNKINLLNFLLGYMHLVLYSNILLVNWSTIWFSTVSICCIYHGMFALWSVDGVSYWSNNSYNSKYYCFIFFSIIQYVSLQTIIKSHLLERLDLEKMYTDWWWNCKKCRIKMKINSIPTCSFILFCSKIR